MIIDQIDRQRFEVRAITDAGWDVGGKLGIIDPSAMRTDFVDQAVFGDFQFDRRQIKDLACFRRITACDGCERLLTMGTSLPRVALDMIRVRAGFERPAGMPFLTTGLSAARLASRFDRLGGSVAGRRMTTIAAVGGQSGFQFGDPIRQSLNLLDQTQDECDDRFRSSIVNSFDLVSCHRSFTLSIFSHSSVCLIADRAE